MFLYLQTALRIVRHPYTITVSLRDREGDVFGFADLITIECDCQLGFVST
jgi:hypothetical protein